MKLLFPLLSHFLVTLARLVCHGGLRSVVAESLAVKHQLLIMKRSQRRGSSLRRWQVLVGDPCFPTLCSAKIIGVK